MSRLVRDYLELEFQSLALPFPFSLEHVVDDFVLFCMLIGNDFLPCEWLPHISHLLFPCLNGRAAPLCCVECLMHIRACLNSGQLHILWLTSFAVCTALPTLDINEGALDKIFAIYKEILPATGYLTHAGQLHADRLEALLQRLALLEQDTLEQRAAVSTHTSQLVGVSSISRPRAWAIAS